MSQLLQPKLVSSFTEVVWAPKGICDPEGNIISLQNVLKEPLWGFAVGRSSTWPDTPGNQALSPIVAGQLGRVGDAV